MPPTQDEAKRALQTLIDQYNRMTEADRLQMTEASVVRQFIDRLLEEVLGWPIKEPARYKYELSTQAGRPDITLIPESGGTIFLEAKRFGRIAELEAARQSRDLSRTITPEQMTLPGMAVDRTPEEQQAINYAFVNNGEWAILTNFERLRLFNARKDWLVISFEKPEAYLEDFGYLWQLAYENVCNGSLNALSNQRWTKEVDTDYLAFINRERLSLARDIVTHRDANRWAFESDSAINLPLLRSVVQRFLDRLVVVRFAEDHFVIPPGTLRQFYELRKTNPYTRPLDEYLDHFFSRFNEDHNSALFSRGPVDEASFSDDALLPLIEELYRARYRSMPADIIGNTYEQYLGKALALDNGSVTTRDNLETRKKQGSYYTPQVIVRYIVDHSLGRWLYGTVDGQPDGELADGETRKTASDIRDLRVLDSACGSGSFLIYAYQVLAGFYQSELDRLEREGEARRQELVAQGMTSPLDLQVQLTPYTAERERIQHYPRIILENHLYGVDLDPQAAEIAVVNLIMRAMERRGIDKRLPLILNQNVKVGNSLIGLRPDDERLAEHRDALAALRRLRVELVNTPHTDPDHARIMDEIEAARAGLYAAFEADYAAHFSDLNRARPFHWGVEFPEAFYDADGQPLEDPGFTIIFGNPPWEIVKPDLREFYAQFDERIESKLNRRQVEQRIVELNAEDPRHERDWQATTQLIERSAAYYRATSDYTRQGRGDTATHKLFTERSWVLLADGGRLGYVVPSGIYTDLGTKDLRQMLLDEGHIQYIYSFSNERFFFPGVHHDFKFALIGAQKGVSRDGFWATFRFNPRVAVAPDELPEFLADQNNLIYVKQDSLDKFSPDSLSVMEFQTRLDYATAGRIYADYPLLGDEIEDCWNLDFVREFDMANDSGLFNQKKRGLPLYEGKMIHQYDAYFAEPRYWIEESAGIEKLRGSKSESWFHGYRFAFREVSNISNARTTIATILPPKTFAGHTLWVGAAPDTHILLFYVAMVNSFCIDWLVRFKASKHVTLFLMKSLPIPRLTAGNPVFDGLVARAARLVCTRAEFADLWQSVMGTAWVAPQTPVEATHESPLPSPLQPVIDPAARQQVRNEIDVLVAHLYELTRAEFEHILRTFPLVFPGTPAGEAKLQALLDEYDRQA
ncbi:MAG: hypothetical protein CL610_12475 [Anaerolineaceae bacterium]|nr:hypothetical protein [Anaerolineaceae bacterium]